MNSIFYTNKAAKQIRKLPSEDAKKIVSECKKLQNFPDCLNIKKLVNHEYGYRFRLGNYRVFFDFDGAIKIVTIEEVKKRDDRTY